MLSADVAQLAPPAHVAFAQPATRGWRTVVVRAGDTIWDIAQPTAAPQVLVTKNRLAAGGSVIHPGQRLLVPGTTPASATGRVASAPTAASRVHVVRAGETMSSIADRYRVTLTKLLAANRLANPRHIVPGQRIAVPGPRSSTPKAASRPKPTSENTFAGYTYPDATVAAAKRNRAALAKADLPTRTEAAAMIRRTAARHGVDPRLALAISWQESGWSQRAVSVANAIGTMQLIPSSGTGPPSSRDDDSTCSTPRTTSRRVSSSSGRCRRAPTRRSTPSPATTKGSGRCAAEGCSRTPSSMSPPSSPTTSDWDVPHRPHGPPPRVPSRAT